MGVTATLKGIPLDRLELVDEALMREVGDLATTRIRRRTEQGVGVDGATFKPLSQGYAREKRKALGHDKADLTVSGRMLNDMGATQATKDTVTVAFRSQGPGARGGTFIQRSRSVGANDKAFYNHEGGRVLRPFFELNSDDETAIADAVERHLDRVIAGQ